MGSLQQAVLEFDEAVQAPWRPALRLVPAAPPGEPVRGGRPPARPAEGRPTARPGAYRDRVARSGAAVATRVTAPALASRVPERPEHRPDRRSPRDGRSTAGRPGTGRIRLTRRARRLAVVVALALGVALGSWLGPLLAGGDAGDLRLAGVSTVVVEPGDTLWSVAASVAGDRDVRVVVDEIQQLNRLDGTELQPGQVLQLP